MRRIGLAVGILAILAIGFVALAGGPGTLPKCDGSFQGTLDSGPDAAFATREDAAVHALEITYDVSPNHLVLQEDRGALFTVTEMDGVALEAPPTVAIERIEAGFVPTGVIC